MPLCGVQAIGYSRNNNVAIDAMQYFTQYRVRPQHLSVKRLNVKGSRLKVSVVTAKLRDVLDNENSHLWREK